MCEGPLLWGLGSHLLGMEVSNEGLWVFWGFFSVLTVLAQRWMCCVLVDIMEAWNSLAWKGPSRDFSNPPATIPGCSKASMGALGMPGSRSRHGA